MRRKEICSERILIKPPSEITDDTSKLRHYLTQSGRLSEDEFRRAEDYALTRKIPIGEAILFLNLMNYREFGESLAEIYGRSYSPLLKEPPQKIAKEMVPLKLAERWNIFPVTYDQKRKVVTLAVDNPEDPGMVAQVKTTLPSGINLKFTVAAGAEIVKAIDVHYRGKTYTPVQDLEVPCDFAILISGQETEVEKAPEEETRAEKKVLLLEPDLARAGALKTILRCEGFRHVNWVLSPHDAARTLNEESLDFFLVNGRTFQRQGSWLKDIPKEMEFPNISYYDMMPILFGQEYAYYQMSEALMSLAAFHVRKSLESDPYLLQETLTRVRYCKLLALRLDLFPSQIDAVVLAAWFSAEGVGKELCTGITTPFDLMEIIDPKSGSENRKRIETKILEMVKKYQALKRKVSEVSHDINQLRGLLKRQLSSPESEAILETFLHLIKDEEFLRRVDQPAGIILIVDPSESKESSMPLRLSNDGYEIEIVQDARKAVDMISRFRVDLVVSEINLPGTDGISFCRALRESSLAAHIPFFFLTTEEGERLPAKCLEAGADDFMEKPVDLEVLSLKIRRVLAMKAPQKSRRGVNGSLTEMNSTDFIQSLSEGQKGVEITLESMGERGKIYMQEGEIIHAYMGDLHGEEAFYRLMAWQEGEFQIVPCSNFPPRTIHHSTMSLLMEAARISDEADSAKENED